jgi:hypothetical protein
MSMLKPYNSYGDAPLSADEARRVWNAGAERERRDREEIKRRSDELERAMFERPHYPKPLPALVEDSRSTEQHAISKQREANAEGAARRRRLLVLCPT